ncbi:MAG: glutathione synthase [Coxiella-like endosymbiont]
MNVGILMDPIHTIHVRHDTSFAFLLTLQARQHKLYYLEPTDIFLKNGEVFGFFSQIHVQDNTSHWFALSERKTKSLNELDILLIRKDPPFNTNYLYLTHLLELSEKDGLFVVNKPRSLRDANEKLFTSWFPHCTPKTLVTSNRGLLIEFAHELKQIVIKPLYAMAGQSVFRLSIDDPNIPVIIEMMTTHGNRLVMAQQFIPEIKQGDKRIILINGEPAAPYALARIPATGDFRGNLAVGARGEGRELTDRDRWICKKVGPTLREKGLWFAGLDVIGDYLTEINVTSPTGVRELEAQFNIDISGKFIEFLEIQYSERGASR